jgi:hypothetical protein
MEITTRWNGSCRVCRQTIPKGTRVEIRNGGLYHLRCARDRNAWRKYLGPDRGPPLTHHGWTRRLRDSW